MRATVLEAMVRGLAATWRIQIDGGGYLDAARLRGPVLFAPWHEALIPLVWHHRHRDITLLVGRHADAGLLATVATRLGYGLARGSSSRDGAVGLRHLIRALASGRDGAVTPDGPRGPRRRVKAGILKAAQLTGAVIVPVLAHTRFGMRIHSWDRMLVPGPGAVVTIRYAEGMMIPRGRDPRDADVGHLQTALDELAHAS